MKQIDSKTNEQFKAIKEIVQSASARREKALAWIEGDRLCDAYLTVNRSRPQLQKLAEKKSFAIYSKSRFSQAKDILSASEIESAWVLDDGLFAQLSDVQTPSGRALLISTDPWSATDGLTEIGPKEDLVILDRVSDPGNAGTLMRTAAAAGVKHIFCTPGTVDYWSPKVLRSGMGAHFAMQTLAVVDPQKLLEFVSGSRRLLITAQTEGATSLYSEKLDLRAPLTWVFGQEGSGVDEIFLKRGNAVWIPQNESVESLNVSAAAAICLFEAYRRRML